LRDWLIKREATWVKHRDFDEAMYMIAREFDLDEPERPASFDAIFENNQKKYDELWRDAGLNPAPENAPVRKAVQEDASKRSDPVAMLVNAYKLEKTDPDAADKTYLEGIVRYPSDAYIILTYAQFLHKVRNKNNKAEQFYQKSLIYKNRDPDIIAGYAGFLFAIGRDIDGLDKLEQCEGLNPDPRLESV
jgi:hypothetical protein